MAEVRPRTPSGIPASRTVSVPAPAAGQSTSTADGTTWECTTDWTSVCADDGSATGTVTKLREAGSGWSRNSASVATARVP